MVHGTEDRILPFAATADRLPGPDRRRPSSSPVEGGPHNIGWTHPEEVNAALLEFLDQPQPMQRRPLQATQPGA